MNYEFHYSDLLTNDFFIIRCSYVVQVTSFHNLQLTKNNTEVSILSLNSSEVKHKIESTGDQFAT